METTTDTKDIGARVDELRTARRLTSQQLAAEAKIPFTTLQRRLAGDGLMTVPELSRISAALGVTPSTWFLEESA
jgi:transcriptional regulator with XRE-family HTH domain